MKIMEFSRQGPRAVCIISGSGRVSNVTLRHPNSSGGILTYEVCFYSLKYQYINNIIDFAAVIAS